MHEIISILSHSKRTLSSEFRHSRVCANRNIELVSWGHTLVSSQTRDRVQGVTNTLTVKNAGKELKATVQCQVHVTTERPVRPAQLQFPRCCQLQDCDRVVGTNDAPRGIACWNEGRTGHHLAALLNDLFCRLQSLCHLSHRPHPGLTLKHQFTQLAPEGLRECPL